MSHQEAAGVTALVTALGPLRILELLMDAGALVMGCQALWTADSRRLQLPLTGTSLKEYDARRCRSNTEALQGSPGFRLGLHTCVRAGPLDGLVTAQGPHLSRRSAAAPGGFITGHHSWTPLQEARNCTLSLCSHVSLLVTQHCSVWLRFTFDLARVTRSAHLRSVTITAFEFFSATGTTRVSEQGCWDCDTSSSS